MQAQTMQVGGNKKVRFFDLSVHMYELYEKLELTCYHVFRALRDIKDVCLVVVATDAPVDSHPVHYISVECSESVKKYESRIKDEVVEAEEKARKETDYDIEAVKKAVIRVAEKLASEFEEIRVYEIREYDEAYMIEFI